MSHSDRRSGNCPHCGAFHWLPPGENVVCHGCQHSASLPKDACDCSRCRTTSSPAQRERDRFEVARTVLAALMVSHDWRDGTKGVAGRAVAAADALLEALEEPPIAAPVEEEAELVSPPF